MEKKKLIELIREAAAAAGKLDVEVNLPDNMTTGYLGHGLEGMMVSVNLSNLLNKIAELAEPQLNE